MHIEDLYAARERAASDANSIKNPDQFDADIHPFHAVYASVPNYISVLAEHLSALKEFKRYAGIVEKSMDTHMPGYPPMSPITDSFFSFWAFVVGRRNWLISGSPHGAHVNATLYSPIEAARANGLEPYRYIAYIFSEVPTASTDKDFAQHIPKYLDQNECSAFLPNPEG